MAATPDEKYSGGYCSHLLIEACPHHLRCTSCSAEFCPVAIKTFTNEQRDGLAKEEEESRTVGCYGISTLSKSKKKKGNRNLTINIPDSNWKSPVPKRKGLMWRKSKKKEFDDPHENVSRNLCAEHSEVLEFWCQGCLVIMCKVCLSNIHKNCDWRLRDEMCQHSCCQGVKRTAPGARNASCEANTILVNSLLDKVRSYHDALKLFSQDFAICEQNLLEEHDKLLYLRECMNGGKENEGLEQLMYLFQEPRNFVWRICKAYQDVKEAGIIGTESPDSDFWKLFSSIFQKVQNKIDSKNHEAFIGRELKEKKLDPFRKLVTPKLGIIEVFDERTFNEYPTIISSTTTNYTSPSPVSSSNACSSTLGSSDKQPHFTPSPATAPTDQKKTVDLTCGQKKRDFKSEHIYSEPLDIPQKTPRQSDPVYEVPLRVPVGEVKPPVPLRTDVRRCKSQSHGSGNRFPIKRYSVHSQQEFNNRMGVMAEFKPPYAGIKSSPSASHFVPHSSNNLPRNRRCMYFSSSDESTNANQPAFKLHTTVIRNSEDAKEFMLKVKAKSALGKTVEIWDDFESKKFWSSENIINFFAELHIPNNDVKIKCINSFFYADDMNSTIESALYNFLERKSYSCKLVEVTAFMKPDFALSVLPDSVQRFGVVVNSPLDWKKLMKIWTVLNTKFRSTKQLHMRISIYSGAGPDSNDVRHAKALPCSHSANIFNFDDHPNQVDLFLHFVELPRDKIPWMLEVLRRVNKFIKNFTNLNSLTLCLPYCFFTSEDFRRMLHHFPNITLLRISSPLPREERMIINNLYLERGVSVKWSVGQLFRSE